MSYDPDHRVSCAAEGCYATINLAPKDYDRMKRTGESFYCPAGHSNYFPGKTKDQKKIDTLESKVWRLDLKLGEKTREVTKVERQRDTAIELVRRCPVCAATPPRYLRIYRDPFRFDDDLAAVREWMVGHIESEHMAEVRGVADDR